MAASVIGEVISVVIDVVTAAGPVVAGLVGRWLDGDRSEEVKRVVDTLPDPLRSRVELTAQRLQTERELAAALAARAGVVDSEP